MGNSQSAMSLSVYNRPVSLSRPKTASVNILGGIKGLEPVEAGEDGAATITERPQDPRFPADFELPPSLQMLARTGVEQARAENMAEIMQIKEKLAGNGVHVSMGVLQRAIMIPELEQCKPSEKQYPDAGAMLMANPFPKPKKKKKGKKKKK